MNSTYICRVCAYPCTLTTESSCVAIEERHTCPYMPLDAEWTKQLTGAESKEKSDHLKKLKDQKRCLSTQIDDLGERIDVIEKELGNA